MDIKYKNICRGCWKRVRQYSVFISMRAALSHYYLGHLCLHQAVSGERLWANLPADLILHTQSWQCCYSGAPAHKYNLLTDAAKSIRIMHCLYLITPLQPLHSKGLSGKLLQSSCPPPGNGLWFIFPPKLNCMRPDSNRSGASWIKLMTKADRRIPVSSTVFESERFYFWKQ